MAKKQTNDGGDDGAQRAKMEPILQDKILQAFSVVAKREKNVAGLKAAMKSAKEDLEAAKKVLLASLAEAAGDLGGPLFDHAEQFVDNAAAGDEGNGEDDPDKEADEAEEAA